MKITIVVLIALLANMPVFAQPVSVKKAGPVNFFQPEKKRPGFIYDQQGDSQRFMELYNQHHPVGKKTATTPGTFMKGPSVLTIALPVEISRNANTLYQRYAAGLQQPSTALQLLGFFGGIAATAFYPTKYRADYFPSYTGNTDRMLYPNKNAAVDAYLKSTYRQHEK